MTNLSAAILRKSQESAELTRRFFVEQVDRVAECARAVDQALQAGGRIFTFGNGGSACDAAHLSVEFCHPVVEKRRACPAMALPADVAWSTAIGNDDDFSVGFARQLELHVRPGDIAIGLSTSGQSRNVIRALRTARAHNALTIGFAGRDGGAIRDACDHVFIVPSFSIHRIQEVHTVLLHVLWDAVHLARGAEDVL